MNEAILTPTQTTVTRIDPNLTILVEYVGSNVGSDNSIEVCSTPS